MQARKYLDGKICVGEAPLHFIERDRLKYEAQKLEDKIRKKYRQERRNGKSDHELIVEFQDDEDVREYRKLLKQIWEFRPSYCSDYYYVNVCDFCHSEENVKTHYYTYITENGEFIEGLRLSHDLCEKCYQEELNNPDTIFKFFEEQV